MITNPEDHLYSTKTELVPAQSPVALLRLLWELAPLSTTDCCRSEKKSRTQLKRYPFIPGISCNMTIINY